ncbi:uncharacterized protein LOC110463370 [Mizuhopecten yessoensis]|uniref:Nucleoporin NUP42 n=1 Tax=Mizuhopecten yessoensis TaxID=6573 RepID=A0A210PW97_MIZYE|nr:uncharacterized protein LOC110463370 [Mizuhopecten yessoensis]OWF40768.1 Uncharacterized protein C18H10.09 [Mizuhopecten yessoensis]
MFNNPQSICQYYNTARGCKFGTNCKFSHVNIPSSHPANINKDETVKRNSESTPQSAALYSNPPIDHSHEEAVRNTVVTQSPGLETSSHLSLEDAEENEVKAKRCFQHYKYGHCRFGAKCRFIHSDNLRKSDQDEEKKSTQQVKIPLPELAADTTPTVDKHDGSKSGKKTKTPVTCRYFIAGRCRSGNKCRFYHPRGNEKLGGTSAYKTSQEDDVSEQTSPKEISGKGESKPSKNPKVTVATRPAFKPPALKREISRDKAGKDIIEKLQTTEIAQLKKRFPTDKLKIVKESDDGENIYCLSFKPTDPDWPFDVDVYDIQLTFPPSYPVKMFKAEVPTDQDLPETLRRYVEASICEWLNHKETELENRGVLELTFRPFIHWLDKEMEDIVTEGLKQLQRELMAKAAGFEFIPASVLRERLRGKNSDGSEVGEEDATESDEDSDSEKDMENVVAYRKKDEEQVYTGPEAYSSDEDDTDDLDVVTGKFEEANLNAERRGTEIRLRNLVMKETVATMTYTQIKIVVQCSRCKSNTDLMTPVGRVNLIPCFKCHTQMLLTFRPAIMHSYSSIMGYLDLEGCVPFDLLLQDSAYKLGCMNCNKETKVDSLYPGQPMDTWCKSCHQKLRVAAEDAKFTLLQSTGVETEKKEVHEVSVKKVKRIVKDPVIRFGNPLPDNGTCKHYKKSFRWFRFPCCGKCYACDLCHEEREDGHEMVLANRMICGFCCREQPFALERPCLSCGHSMTKSTTHHWEGGMGCRDKIRMGRNDSQKYANMNKTISRKAIEKKQPNKKKNIKLRHSSN